MPEDPLAKYKTKNVGDPLAKYKAPTQIPEEEPLQEMGVNLEERTALKSFAGDIPSQIEWLQREPGVEGKPKSFGLWVNDKGEAAIPWAKAHQYEAREYKPGHIAVRLKGSTGPWKVVDPDTGLFSKDILADIWDIAPELAAAYSMPISKPLAIGGTVALGETAGSLIGKQGIRTPIPGLHIQSPLGFKQDYSDIAKHASEKMLEASVGAYGIGKVAPLVTKGISGAANVAGKGLQKPLELYEKWTGEAARKASRAEKGKIGIERSEISELQNELKTQKSGFAKEFSEKMDEARRLDKEEADRLRGIAEESKKIKAIRGVEEKAQLAEEGMAAGEYQKEISRIQSLIKEEKKNLSEVLQTEEKGLGTQRSDAIREKIDFYSGEIEKLKNKAIETQSRARLGKVQILKRNAQEAKEGFVPPKEQPITQKIEPANVPQEKPTTYTERISPGERLTEEEAEKIFYKLRLDRIEGKKIINGEAGQIQKETAGMAARGSIPWKTYFEIREEVWGSEAPRRLKDLEDSIHREIMDTYRRLGLSEKEAIQKAALADKVAEISELVGYKPAETAKLSSGLASGRVKPSKIKELVDKFKERPEQKKIETLAEEIGRRKTEVQKRTTKYLQEKQKLPPAPPAWERVAGFVGRGGLGGYIGYATAGLPGMVAGSMLGTRGLEASALAGKGLQKLSAWLSRQPQKYQTDFLGRHPEIRAALYGLRVSP